MLFQSHAKLKKIQTSTSFVMVLLIYNENCIEFNGNCNGACWSLRVIGRIKKKNTLNTNVICPKTYYRKPLFNCFNG